MSAPLPPISAEIAARIAATSPAALPALCASLGDLTLEQAKHEKYNPKTYFKTLTLDPDALMKHMRYCNGVLSGSRAAAFFYPTACGINSDWDFYISGGDVAAARFTYAMTKLGATWEGNSHVPDGYGEYKDTFHVLQGKLNGHSVQVMWNRRLRKGVFKTILEFHSSIVQCFMSGWCAVSLYHNLGAQNKMIASELDERQHPLKRAKAPTCVAKYVERGFQVVRYPASVQVIGLPRKTVDANLNLPWSPRSVSDEGCLVINFDVYMEDVNIACKDLHTAAMEEIMGLKWAEGMNSELKAVRTRESAKCGMYRALRSQEPHYRLQGYVGEARYGYQPGQVRFKLEEFCDTPHNDINNNVADCTHSYPIPWWPTNTVDSYCQYIFIDKDDFPPV